MLRQWSYYVGFHVNNCISFQKSMYCHLIIWESITSKEWNVFQEIMSFHWIYLFFQALREAFEVFCNKTVAGSSTSELLALFCDYILKKGGSGKLSDEVVEENLEKVDFNRLDILCQILRHYALFMLKLFNFYRHSSCFHILVTRITLQNFSGQILNSFFVLGFILFFSFCWIFLYLQLEASPKTTFQQGG